MSPLEPLLRRARSVDPRVIDAGLALVLSAWGLAEPGALDSLSRTMVLLAMTFAIAWRRRRPLEVLIVAVLGVILEPRGVALPEVLAVLIAAHSVSVMVLQTGAARQIMSRDQQRSQALLESVEASGRPALDELRRLLGPLSDEDGSAPLQPRPGVAEIPSLIDQVRNAGLPVELSVEGSARTVAPRVAIAAYRIVQEALTNVLKHDHGAPTRVVVRYDVAALELEILDHGMGETSSAGDAKTGRGLAGMRERAAMYGGTLDAHAEPRNGYAVRARIPREPSGG